MAPRLLVAPRLQVAPRLLVAPRFDKGFRVWKGSQGMEKVSGYGKGIMVLKWCQDMEMVPGYGNGIGLGWYKKASVYGIGMHHALLDKLSSLKGLL